MASTSDKKQKIETLSDVDMISNIPQTVQAHILSFLPIKDAVRTSLLSKKWKYIWTLMTCICIDDRVLAPMIKTQKNVWITKNIYKLLLQLSSSSFHNFVLHLFMKNYELDSVEAWISSIFRRGVQNIVIDISMKDSLESVFPSSIFSCRSLEEIVIKMKATLRVPPSNHLVNLQILKLFRMKIQSADSSRELVLNFPVLKAFEVDYCTWSRAQSVVITAPQLENFSSVHAQFLPFNDNRMNFNIWILAPNLRKFTYSGITYEVITLPDPCSVMEAMIDMEGDYLRGNFHLARVRTHNLIQHLRKLEVLELKSYMAEVLVHFDDQHISMLPIFQRLSCLHIDLCYPVISFQMLLLFLRKWPNLHKLVFLTVTTNFNDENTVVSQEVPACFESSLRLVEIRRPNDHLAVLHLAKYVLTNSKVLEKMIIDVSAMSGKKIDVLRKRMQSISITSLYGSVRIVGDRRGNCI